MTNNTRKLIAIILLLLLLLTNISSGIIVVADEGVETTNSEPTEQCTETMNPTISRNNSFFSKIVELVKSIFEKIYNFFINIFTSKNLDETNKMTVYGINDREVFYKLVENPSLDMLNCQVNRMILSKLKYYEGSIRFEKEINGELIDYGNKFGSFNIEGLFIDSRLIDFAGDIKKVEKYLARKCIKGTIDSISVICTASVPAIIWVKANQENYFITINEKLEFGISYTDIHYTKYEYQLYDHSDYLEKFMPKDANLIVNGKDILSGQNIKLHFRYAELPFIAVLNALGAQTEWLEDGISILVKVNSEEYIIDTKKHYILYNGIETNLREFTGAFTLLDHVGEELIADTHIAQTIINLIGLNANVSIDHKNLTVNI